MRPFESLEWYREAQRGFDHDHPWLSRARNFGLVRTHVSLLAVGAVALLAVNLIRSPEHVWADTAIVAWGLLVLMHAVAAGIVALIMQLLAEDEDLRPGSEIRWDPLRTWTLPANETGQPVTIHENGSPAPAEPSAPPPPPASGWRIAEPAEREPPPPEERASWKEAAAAAWLERRRGPRQDGQAAQESSGEGAGPAPETAPGPPPDAPDRREERTDRESV